jgi:hypothetical protein
MSFGQSTISGRKKKVTGLEAELRGQVEARGFSAGQTSQALIKGIEAGLSRNKEDEGVFPKFGGQPEKGAKAAEDFLLKSQVSETKKLLKERQKEIQNVLGRPGRRSTILTGGRRRLLG